MLRYFVLGAIVFMLGCTTCAPPESTWQEQLIRQSDAVCTKTERATITVFDCLDKSGASYRFLLGGEV